MYSIYYQYYINYIKIIGLYILIGLSDIVKIYIFVIYEITQFDDKGL